MNFSKHLTMALTMIMSFLNIKALPIEEGKVAFSDDQASKLKEQMTDETLQQLIEAFNKEIAENDKVKTLNAQIEGLLTEMKGEGTPTSANGPPTDSAEPHNLDTASENIKALENQYKAKIAELDKTVKALIKEPEPDSPIAIVKNQIENKIMKHSATYLFGSNKDYDAFTGRNWNALAAGLTTSATDFSDKVTVEKLNGDMDLYFRENPDKIQSLLRDNFGLPEFWPKRMKVEDKVTSASIVTAEVSQARKLPWLPKNKQSIKAEVGQIYPISIDLEWEGHNLSKIESSWLNSFNKEGSQAYKLSFVRFLVDEISKKGRIEDRVASIKGVYVETPENATSAGKFINRQNGLLYLAWKARDVDQKYSPFSLGVPTTSNIVDYVDNFIKKLPQEVRVMQGLQLLLSDSWIKAYKRKYETLYALHTDYDGTKAYPKDYPNIKFVPMVDFEGSDFMLLTTDDNIEILENIPSEKSMYHFEMLKRKIYVFADYKLGIRFQHIGNKLEAGDPDEFKVQTVWSNDVPIFGRDDFATLYEGGALEVAFNQYKVVDGHMADITKITGLKPGQIIKIMGNTTASSMVKNSAEIILNGGDFDLSTGGTLTLYVQDDLKLKELTRTTSTPTSTTSLVMFDTETIDANDGTHFQFNGTVSGELKNIENGFEGQKITLYGQPINLFGIDPNNTSIINLTSEPLLDFAEGNYAKLIKIGEKWYVTEYGVL